MGNILISRVYYVEGLGHNLFSVGEFCDSDLEVALRKQTCFVRNLEGVDLLSGSRSSNLYTISMDYNINQSKYALEMLKKYGLDQCDSVDVLLVERLKLDEDPNGTLFDPTRYRDAGHVGFLDSRKSTSGSAQFLGEKLILWMWSQLTDYGFDYKKILLYYNSQSAIALSCNTVEHSRMKHIAVRYHFIKEQVENGIVEFYFVKTAYQLADIFTKALARERFEFLVKRLGMQSITPE
ncbi:hypothetical protein Tco_1398855 [Tanacetum coccineum]